MPRLVIRPDVADKLLRRCAFCGAWSWRMTVCAWCRGDHG